MSVFSSPFLSGLYNQSVNGNEAALPCYCFLSVIIFCQIQTRGRHRPDDSAQAWENISLIFHLQTPSSPVLPQKTCFCSNYKRCWTTDFSSNKWGRVSVGFMLQLLDLPCMSNDFWLFDHFNICLWIHTALRCYVSWDLQRCQMGNVKLPCHYPNLGKISICES